MNSNIIKREKIDYEPNERGIGYELWYCMRLNADKVAQIVVDTNESDTYATLLKKSIRTALKIRALGVNQCDIISLCSHNQINSVVPLIASQFLGNVFAALDPTQSVEESTHLLNQTKPKIIFVTEDALTTIKSALNAIDLQSTIVVLFGKSSDKNVLSFEEFLQPQINENLFEPAKIKSPKQTALIFFSSGTTGLPKGICLHHYGIMSQVTATFSLFPKIGKYCEMSNYSLKQPGTEHDEQFGCLNYTTFYWISSIWFLFTAAFTGQIRIVAKAFDKDQWWDLIDKYNIMLTMSPPNQLIDILSSRKAKTASVASLKILCTGGSSVTKQLMEDAFNTFPQHVSILQGYGQTESAGILALFPDTQEGRAMQRKKFLSCGFPVPGFTYKIADIETNKILGPNERGELRYKTDFSMVGYFNRDDADAYDEDGWLKSGDIVYYDEDQCLYVVDRIKEMFKFQSWHIVPAALENVLVSHPAVKTAVVIGIPHGAEGDHPMGLVILKEEAEATPEELEKFVEERVLDRQRLRAGVKIVKEFPLTITGKVKRRTVKEMVLNNEL